MSLNRRARWIVEMLWRRPEDLRIAVHPIEGGGRFVDCGIEARGGLLAGIELARICLADLAQVAIVPGEVGGRPIPLIQVVTDHPVRACLASQYAGWAIKEGKFFAMGSGPMRAAAGTEAIYDAIGFRETAERGRRRAGDAQAADAGGRRQDRRGLPGRARRASRCWSPRRPAWPAACRSWPGRSRPPCTSWPS